jgi:hypothetical protein
MVGYIENIVVDLKFVAKHNLTMKPTKNINLVLSCPFQLKLTDTDQGGCG